MVGTRSFVAGVLALLVGASSASGDDANGRVLTSQGPVVGATVTLFVAGTEIGAPATELGSDTTVEGGKFNISFAPSNDPDALYYLLADGPNPGVRLATAVGDGLPPKRLTINELTTVATAYTMAQFLDASSISGVAPGPQNAASIMRNFVNINTGSLGHRIGTAPNGTDTDALYIYNGLCNLLSGAIDGNLGTGPLFMLATPPGGVAPNNTLQAMLNIAHFPWNNQKAIWAVSRLTPTFHPQLTESPETWTLALLYVGNGREFDGPGNVVIDADGNAWSNQNYIFRENAAHITCGSRIVSKLRPNGDDFPGAPYTGGGINGAGFGITLDLDGNCWVGNFGFFGSTCPCIEIPPANSVSKISPDGVAISPSSGFTQGCVNAPQATVCDQSGNIWIANQCGGTVTFYRNGDPDDNWIYDIATNTLIDEMDCGPFSGLGPKPFGIAIDRDGNAWVSNNQGANADATVFKLSPQGQRLALLTAKDGINRPMDVSTDLDGNVWVNNSAIVSLPCASCDMVQDFGDLTLADEAFFSVGQYDSDGMFIRELRGGGIHIPWGNAIDGAGNLWVANFGGYRVSHFDGQTGEPIAPSGYWSNALERVTSVTIDPSGNVWLANNWNIQPELTNPGGDGLVLFVGIAAPVKTPVFGPPNAP